MRRHGLALGATTTSHKPITPAIVLARVRNHLELKAARDLLHDQNAFLEQEVERRTRENRRIQNITIHSSPLLPKPATTRPQPYPAHPALCAAAGGDPLRACPLSCRADPKTIDLLFKSAPLHDIGKVGVPDPDPAQAWQAGCGRVCQMKHHSILGKEAIVHAEAWGRGGISATGKEDRLLPPRKGGTAPAIPMACTVTRSRSQPA